MEINRSSLSFTKINFKWETIWNCFVISFTYKLLQNWSFYWCAVGRLQSQNHAAAFYYLVYQWWDLHYLIIHSKEGRVFFIDCWRNKNPIILSAFSENSIYNALLNVGNFMVVYSNMKVWQIDQFLTTCDVIDVQS